MQHHRPCQVQLVGICLHFKLLSGILQVTNPFRGKRCCLTRQVHFVFKPDRLSQIHTYKRQCEHRHWGLPLTSSPSFLSVALLWACGLRWLLREPWKQRTQPGRVRAASQIDLADRTTVQEQRGRQGDTAEAWYLLLSLGHLRSDVCLNLCGVLNRLRPQYSHQIGDAYFGGQMQHQLGWSKIVVALIWAYL